MRVEAENSALHRKIRPCKRAAGSCLAVSFVTAVVVPVSQTQGQYCIHIAASKAAVDSQKLPAFFSPEICSTYIILQQPGKVTGKFSIHLRQFFACSLSGGRENAWDDGPVCMNFSGVSLADEQNLWPFLPSCGSLCLLIPHSRPRRPCLR